MPRCLEKKMDFIAPEDFLTAKILSKTPLGILGNVEENVNPDKSYCARYLGRNNVRRKNLLSAGVYYMLWHHNEDSWSRMFRRISPL
jgi:hypothetical protein